MEKMREPLYPIPNPRPSSGRRCLSCGTEQIKPGRRYCSKKCRQHMNWVLSLSKGLLRAFNARYATFSYTSEYVILDILPVWSNGISRFMGRRTPGKKPAEDFKELILHWGKKWHHLVNNNNSKSYASFFLIKQTYAEGLDPESIKPTEVIIPRLSSREKFCLKILRIRKEELFSDCAVALIKSAYKKMARVYHPDMGGDEEKFKQLNDAHRHMLMWAKNPNYSFRKAIGGCWSYDGSTNRWSPPL